jgi:hypothetical protein
VASALKPYWFSLVMGSPSGLLVAAGSSSVVKGRVARNGHLTQQFVSLEEHPLRST